MTVLIARPAPPSLEALFQKWGGYRSIPPEAWAGYKLAMARWRAVLTDPIGKLRQSDPADGARTFAAPPSAYPETERLYTSRRWHWWVRYGIWFETDADYIEVAHADTEPPPLTDQQIEAIEAIIDDVVAHTLCQPGQKLTLAAAHDFTVLALRIRRLPIPDEWLDDAIRDAAKFNEIEMDDDPEPQP